MPPRPEYDVAVIGAGIVGASAAWHLAGRGLSVVVIDRSGPAAAASGASDGAVSVASKKPGVLARLASHSLIYTRQLAAGGPLQAAFRERPSYVFGKGAAEIEALDALVAKLAALNGPVRVTGDGGADLLSGLGAGVDRLVALTGEGHMPGHKAVRAYLSGGTIARRWPSDVKGIEADTTGVTITLDTDTLRTSRVIAALGTDLPRLFPQMPVAPRAGQLFVTDRGPAGALSGSLTSAAYLLAKTTSAGNSGRPPVVIDPLATGQFLIGSSREDHGDPARVTFDVLARLLHSAVAAFPAMAERRIIRGFAGIRAAVSDGLPIFGLLPGAPRIMLAAGFEGDGICLSALMGREAAAIAAGDGPAPELARDLAALCPSRFVQAPERVRA